MSTYTQILYQIVFSTKYAEKTINPEKSEKLYRYIWGILKNKKCKLYQINGTENHIHILTHIHSSVSLSSLVKDIKVSSSIWMKQEKFFPLFKSWQNGYGAFTYHYNQKNILIKYIKNQREHHRIKTFQEELVDLLNEHGIEFDEKFLV